MGKNDRLKYYLFKTKMTRAAVKIRVLVIFLVNQGTEFLVRAYINIPSEPTVNEKDTGTRMEQRNY